jgi:hypothetical protein
MCKASNHVPHREAADRERLFVRKLTNDRRTSKGLYHHEAPDDQLVCLRGEIAAVIREVRFEEGLYRQLIDQWEGKRNVAVTLRNNYWGDTVIFSDGKATGIANLKEGVRIDIDNPREEVGMAAVASAVRQALAVPPAPAPKSGAPKSPIAPTEGET